MLSLFHLDVSVGTQGSVNDLGKDVTCDCFCLSAGRAAVEEAQEKVEKAKSEAVTITAAPPTPPPPSPPPLPPPHHTRTCNKWEVSLWSMWDWQLLSPIVDILNASIMDSARM